MRIIDISMEITGEMPVYKGRDSKRPVLTVDSDFAAGAAYESRIEMNLHTGTHFDSPLHVIPDGGFLEPLPLERVVRGCKVFDFSRAEEKITRGDLEGRDIREGDFVLLRTRNSLEDILEGDFVYLDKTGAALLKERGVGGVGIDSLGIERAQPGHETHKILLGAGILILEGLRLEAVQEGEYFLVAAPLRIAGTEAAPARAFLVEREAL